ncbi:MAG: transcriptional repressor [Clostridia bacterium]|nr:transcriptional repressor [Clostridia bacterium]
MPVHHNTKQKALITEVLENNRNHVTAEDVITLLHKQGEKVGRATVYRYLRELEEAGKVRKYTLGEKNTAYYQYTGEGGDCHGHYHLMCDMCGRLEHLDRSVAESFAKSARESYGFVIDCSKTVFYGKCKNCAGL